jgi:hypothetical protein
MIKTPPYVLIIILICLCMGVYIFLKVKETKEYFDTLPITEEKVIKIYDDILKRQPTSTELINTTRDIKSNTITWDGLRQKLMDSDEYVRMIKLQSNTLAPELDKMLSDARIIREISAIYREVRKKEIPATMILPLRDIYIALNYNPFTLVALLKDKKYDNFEQDIQRVEQLDKEDTLKMFSKTFDQPKLVEKSAEIAKSEEAHRIAALAVTNNSPATSAALSSTPNAATTSAASSSPTASTSATAATAASNPNNLTVAEQAAIREVLNVLGVSPGERTVRAVGTRDSDMSPMARQIQENASRIFNIHDAARRIEQPHHGNMVLRPEFAWSVPQRQPPICNSLGRKPLTQPLLSNSKLLLGTELSESSNTQVGSIMPKFEYKEFVDVPLKG